MIDQTEATNDEFRMALSGLRIQAEAHGLDVHDWNVHTYILHMAEVMALNAAHQRVLENQLRNVEWNG